METLRFCICHAELSLLKGKKKVKYSEEHLLSVLVQAARAETVTKPNRKLSSRAFRTYENSVKNAAVDKRLLNNLRAAASNRRTTARMLK